jgi:glycosyltransferase involved in cell wall biosynthesis
VTGRIAIVSPYTLPFCCGNSFLAERLKEGLSGNGFTVRLFNSSVDAPREAAAFEPDLMHTLNADRPYPWIRTFRAARSIPWVITLTGTDYNSWCGIKDPPAHIRESLEGADALVVFHSEAREVLEDCLPALRGKIMVIPQAVVSSGALARRVELRESYGIGSGETALLLVASIRPVKNLRFAIDGLIRLQRQVGGVKAWLAGPIIDPREADNLFADARQLDHFSYLGEVPPDEVRELMAAADVFLNTSLNEGMPGAVLEAMAEGLPVVASDVTGNRAVVAHERNGLLFPVDRVDALVTALKRLVLDKRLRASLGESGRQVALRDYSAEHEADAHQDLYRNVLGGFGRLRAHSAC